MSEESSNSPEAPFNAAIDCLMRIAGIIKKIEKVSTEYILYTDIQGIKLTAGQAQHMKKRFVMELIKQATPLISANRRKEFWDKVKAVPLKVNTSFNSKTNKTTSVSEVYDDKINIQLDEIVIDVQIDLQDKGRFFMPPRKDPSRAVGEGH